MEHSVMHLQEQPIPQTIRKRLDFVAELLRDGIELALIKKLKVDSFILGVSVIFL